MRTASNDEGTTATKIATSASIRLFVFCVAFVPSWSSAAAQTPATENVTLAPIQCWTRTSSNAVRVGELFTMVLTCAVVETQSTTVVPDQSRLDPGALQAPPFEVVGGAQAADLRTRTHRFFQYEYTLRFIGEQIGADVELPGATITYRVQSRVQGDAAVESRDRQYNLPPRRIRIVSTVPATAADIHDALPETFGAIASRRFRADLLRIASWVLFGIGGVMVAWAVAGLVRRPRAAGAARRRLVPESAVLRTATRELERVRTQRQIEGWTSDLAARALAPLRVAASYATGRPVTQSPTGGAAPSAGQLYVTTTFPRRRAVLVSGSATSVPVDLQAGAHADLHAAMERLTTAAYGRDLGSDSDLDEALARGARGLRQVARRYAPPARLARAVRQSAAGMRDRAWAR